MLLLHKSYMFVLSLFNIQLLCVSEFSKGTCDNADDKYRNVPVSLSGTKNILESKNCSSNDSSTKISLYYNLKFY